MILQPACTVYLISGLELRLPAPAVDVAGALNRGDGMVSFVRVDGRIAYLRPELVAAVLDADTAALPVRFGAVPPSATVWLTSELSFEVLGDAEMIARRLDQHAGELQGFQRASNNRPGQPLFLRGEQVEAVIATAPAEFQPTVERVAETVELPAAAEPAFA